MSARRSASVKALSAERGSCDESHLSGFRMLSMENDDELRLGEDSISDKIVEVLDCFCPSIAFFSCTKCLPSFPVFDLCLTVLNWLEHYIKPIIHHSYMYYMRDGLFV